MMLADKLNSPALTAVGFSLTVIASACVVIASARLFGLRGLLVSSGLLAIAACIMGIIYAGHN